MTADDDVRKQMVYFHDSVGQHRPDLVIYAGPEHTIIKFLAGGVVTWTEYMEDPSEIVVRAVPRAQFDRLVGMLDTTKAELTQETPPTS